MYVYLKAHTKNYGRSDFTTRPETGARKVTTTARKRRPNVSPISTATAKEIEKMENLQHILTTPSRLLQFADDYPLVSYREKSRPGAGSPCYKTSHINPQAIGTITRQINHRNGDITVYVDGVGVLRFWVSRFERREVKP